MTSSIQPLAALLSGAASARTQPGKETRPATPEEKPSGSRPSRPADLAASIMADGGLGFLRSRVQEKLEAVFAAHREKHPEQAPAGPPPFFESSPDLSPEATADRIVGFALGLRSTFGRQNRDLSDEEAQTRFMAEIRRGIEEGFSHAERVLSGLDLLQDEVQDTFEQTWELVQKKLDEASAGAEG